MPLWDVVATVDRIEPIQYALAGAGVKIFECFVRVFNDAIPADAAVPADEDLARLLDVEVQAGGVTHLAGWPHSFMSSLVGSNRRGVAQF